MEIATRPQRPDEWPALPRGCLAAALAMDPMEEMLGRLRQFVQTERTVAALMAKKSSVSPGELAVRGHRPLRLGSAWAAPASWDARPSHRRRGVLRKMMQHHLEDVRRDGQLVAGLWSSESGIYGVSVGPPPT